MLDMNISQSPDMYTIGWIAALPIERAAAIAMLDERHDKPRGFVQHQADSNSYTWGRMSEHNVVIASLPAGSYGTTPAATTASNLLASLPDIRISLLVGIGGGIARPDQGRDIRLGDVVISEPQGTTGGVVQYDLGKTKSNQEWVRKGFLSMPPGVLLHALASLQADHELGESRMSKLLKSLPKLKKGDNGYSHQGFENDRLFKPSYQHQGGHDCQNCDAVEMIGRGQRDSTDPEIHYGTILSGNMLVKDAATRDQIVDSMDEKCICFEMEAAGLMNHFPCIVIRGICDYADSHKNDRWQRYASATAAAYAKELLRYVPTRALRETQAALDVLRSDISAINAVARVTKAQIEAVRFDSHLHKIHGWLSPPDTSTNLNEALKKRQDGTGSWFLESEAFQTWKAGTRGVLWLHGLPGCGKTLLSARLIEYLNQHISPRCVVLDFFFDFTDPKKQTFDSLVRALVAQLYTRCEDSRKELDRLFASCEDGCRQPACEILSTTFMQMLGYIGSIQIIIDALDECKTRTELLPWMENLTRAGHTGLQLLATSRKEADIESHLRGWLDPRDVVPVQTNSVNHDIRAYIHHHLQYHPHFERWHRNQGVRDEIETQLMEKADGIWAACQLEILQGSLDLRMLRETLKSLPRTLEGTYARILASIDENYRAYALRILQFLTYSERPLTIQEAVDIVVIDPNGHPLFDPMLRMPNPQDIVRVCSTLVTLVVKESGRGRMESSTEIRLSHFSVLQYLRSNRIERAFSPKGSECSMIFQNGLNESNARREITRVCLAYLSHLHMQASKKNIRWHSKMNFPFSNYAAQYWMDHARIAEANEDILQIVVAFFMGRHKGYSTWVELFDPHWDFGDLAKRRRGSTPLYYASLGGLQYTVRQLLQKGANINAEGGRYGYVLQAASSRGHVEVVELLLEKDADVNAQGGAYGNALQAASHKGYTEVVQLLLAKGAKVNADSGRFGNALYTASYRGHIEIVQLLLEKGADVNAQGGEHGNALQAAVSFGHLEVMQLLLEKGADVNARGGEYGNALQAASHKGYIEIVQLLLAKGAKVNADGGRYSNALNAASYRGHVEIMQQLLKKGANVNAQSRRYSSALQTASHKGHITIVQLLLKKGANVNAHGGKYGSSLQAASSRGHIEIVQLLLEKYTDVNAHGGKYGSSLQAASSRGHIKIV
ncbi:hypothetical protein PMG11_04381 [Penicillium brasilianum]|uniref:Nephrocystin 3-like N-terminal domain-containing protein n=1 Tax=Penicillium brasilianum TaxID=104259 RepID=A0A0F7VFY9_PENBI|nr:hypothetical protein PMG11_04381 [Penicillium brasilianum]